MTGTSRWDDLLPRTLSAVVMSVLGLGALLAGDPWISGLAVIGSAVMVWELSRMTAPDRAGQALLIAALAAVAMAALFLKHNPFWLAWLLLPAVVGTALKRTDRIGYFIGVLAILFASYAIVAFRGGLGIDFVLWLVLVIVASDTLGYFGGRTIGGPKFWPRLSPKKTWSGTIAGWIGAAGVGAVFWFWRDAPVWAIPFSALVALAGQMGDIGESALKRRAGVKDASHLIPGHGGLIDRLDALSGASLFLLLWGSVLPLPMMGSLP